jgi:hypothetical protein
VATATAGEAGDGFRDPAREDVAELDVPPGDFMITLLGDPSGLLERAEIVRLIGRIAGESMKATVGGLMSNGLVGVAGTSDTGATGTRIGEPN